MIKVVVDDDLVFEFVPSKKDNLLEYLGRAGQGRGSKKVKVIKKKSK